MWSTEPTGIVRLGSDAERLTRGGLEMFSIEAEADTEVGALTSLRKTGIGCKGDGDGASFALACDAAKRAACTKVTSRTIASIAALKLVVSSSTQST